MAKRMDSAVVLPAERIAVDTHGLAGRAPLALVDFHDMLKAAAAARPRNGQWSVHSFGPMLGGQLAYSDDPPSARRMLFQPTSGPRLPLHNAHSLVRAVAGLWAFLTKLARRGDWLIIDELEMNAHPAAQLALTELVAMLVNDGLNVVVTTHSLYVADHLTTLVEAAAAPAEAQADLAAGFALGDAKAFLDVDKVAVHLFEAADATAPNGPVRVREVLDRAKRLIDWTTFGRVTNRAGALYGDVLRAEVAGAG